MERQWDYQEGFVALWVLPLKNVNINIFQFRVKNMVLEVVTEGGRKYNLNLEFVGRIEGENAEVEAPILWHLMQTADSLEKTRMLGKIEGRRRG